MDEILIGEKNYVSSKRAAKMTGYAKDYIGQLCREGRVPARLVGRSWYVLESAIQDHRFGAPDIQPEKVSEASPAPLSAWESPRYEASSEEILPSVNRVRSTDEQLQDSWRAWFDRVAATAEPIAPAAAAAAAAVTPIEETQEEKIENIEEAESVNIPIHTVYDLPPENLLPRHFSAEPESEEEEELVLVEDGGKKSIRGLWVFIRAIQVVGVLLAISVATIAVLGTGYFDTYIASDNRASFVAGVVLYNK